MPDQPAPATDPGTIKLVLVIFGVIAIAGSIGLFILVNKIIGFEDADRMSRSLVALAGLFGIVTGAIGYLAGALTNTRTPQAPVVDAVVKAVDESPVYAADLPQDDPTRPPV